ncbi:hypothetical protein BGY98DRAFT_210762 [Russula aff. rugulosa BPL654]|nr:hypothetical protein BGY98DRAFT_210762 [Russula aff. rugulosa BPL654]
MCHRHLTFKKSSICGHLILTKSQNVDCEDPECYNSSTHPPDCAAQNGRARCWCRRYYTQPNRQVISGQEVFFCIPIFPASFTIIDKCPEQLATQCPSCSSRSSR